MNNGNGDRLSRIEALIESFITASTADRQQSNERMSRIEQAMERDRQESNERLTRVEQITSSNAQSIQALTDDLVTFRLTTEQANQEIKDAVLRLTLGNGRHSILSQFFG